MSRYVQACINSIGFPGDLDQLYSMILKQEEYGEGKIFDIEVLLEYESGKTHWWYAPRWIQPGDLMFFYQTGKGCKNIKRLLRECKSTLKDPNSGIDERDEAADFIEILKYAEDIVGEIESTIFAIAEVDALDCHSGRVDSAHFRGSFFAPIRRIHVLDEPIPIRDFKEIIMVSQSTITPLMADRFVELKRLVEKHNKIPVWISQTKPSSLGLRDINKDNWRDLVTSRRCDFIMEEQVRSYFLDYLLREIADTRDSFFEECDCKDKKNKSLGRADYFIKFEDYWYPVEAKIDVRNTDALEQSQRYIRSRSFTAKRGRGLKRTIELKTDRKACIIGDRKGIYLSNRDGYFASCPDFPLITREELKETSREQVRARLSKALSNI